MGKIWMSAFADEYNPDFGTQIAVLTRLGYPFYEVRFVDGENIADLSEAKVKELSQKLNAGGIKVSAIGSPLGKISLAEDFSAHLEKAKRCFTYGNLLQTEQIRMFSFYLPKGMTRTHCKEEVLDRLGRLLDLAASYGLTLCHENEAGIYGEGPEHCLELHTAFAGRLAAVFDMGNFVLDGYDPWEAYQKLKPYIRYFHIKDAQAGGEIVPPGKGAGRIQEIITDFSKKQDVIATLEPHLRSFQGLDHLTEHHLKLPYTYETPEAAFLHAAATMEELLS